MTELPAKRIKALDVWPRVEGVGRSIALVLFLSLLLQIFAFVSPLQMQIVIDDAIASGDSSLLFIVAVAFGSLVIFQGAVEFIRSRLQILFNQVLGFHTHNRTIRHLIRLPVAFLSGRTIGDLLSRSASPRIIQDTLSKVFLSIILDGIMFLTSLVVMLYYSAQLSLVVIVTFVIVTVTQWAIFPVQRRNARLEMESRADEQTYLMETVRSITTVRTYGIENARALSWRDRLANTVDHTIFGSHISAALGFFRSTVFGLQAVIVVYLGATKIISGDEFTVGMLVAYLAYRTMFVDRAASLLGLVTQVRTIGLHIERASEILGRDPEVAATAPASPVIPEGDIAVASLTVGYGEAPVLSALDFRVPRGGFIAISGPSGCGKSTLVRALVGLIEPRSGSISVGSERLTTTNMPAWRSQLGVVTQSDSLFAGTIGENIALYDAPVDRERMVESALAAQIHVEILDRLGGYDREVGDLSDRLSAGQRQRILLARALYRKPAVLILDEATANLDRENDLQISRIISSLNMTRIVVAHRSEMLRLADQHYALESGRLEKVIEE